MKNLLLLVIILIQFDATAQIILRLTSLSKEDKIEIRNFSNRRLTNSQKFKRMETIEMDFGHSDSLVIRKEGFIPIALVNLDNLTTKEINLELPVVSKYEAIDIRITYTTKSKFLSSKTKTERYEYSPMNSQYLNSFPSEISVTINDKQYLGFLKKSPFESVSNLDGKKFSKSVFCLGIEAIYVIPGIEK